MTSSERVNYTSYGAALTVETGVLAGRIGTANGFGLLRMVNCAGKTSGVPVGYFVLLGLSLLS